MSIVATGPPREEVLEIRCFDELRENVRGLYDVELKTAKDRLAASADFFEHEGMMLCAFSFTPLGFDRDPSRLKQFDNEFVVLEHYKSGSGRGMIDGEPMTVSPASAHLVDWSRRHKSITTQVSGQSLLIPHELIGYDPSRHAAHHSIGTATAGGNILCVTLDRYLAAIREGRAEEAALCADLCVDLVRRLFLDGENSRRTEPAPHLSDFMVRGYIRNHLADTDLGPERICHDLNLSRATLYRLFAEDGGVARYIDGLRLERCFADLLYAPQRRGEVRRIAEAWGFHDASLFNRKFRRHFGMAPSDCLSGIAHDTPFGADDRRIWPINHWLERSSAGRPARHS